jgi:uncharacterized protein
MFKKILKLTAYAALAVFLVLNFFMAFQAYRNTYFYEANEVPFQNFKKISGTEKLKAMVFGVKVPKRKLEEFPTNSYETFTVKDTEGYSLEGWYLPAANAKGNVIVIHGHNSNKGKCVAEIEEFIKLGYNVVAMDVRSHGNSQGNVCTIGYKETEVVLLANNYLKTKNNLPNTLFGYSMGAAIITKAMLDYPQLHVNKIILNYPFGSMQAGVKGFLRNIKLPTFPFADLMLLWGSAERGFWAYSYEPTNYVKQLKVPVLLQIGEKDPRVTQSESEEIFKNIGSKQKKLVSYQGAGHVSLLKHNPVLWKAEVSGFLLK